VSGLKAKEDSGVESGHAASAISLLKKSADLNFTAQQIAAHRFEVMTVFGGQQS
jgi:hypothetical protein